MMQTIDAVAAPEGRSPIALRDMLARISVEIGSAAGTLAGFQDSLSPLSTGVQDQLPSEQLQSLDLLHQTLNELGRVLAALASMPTFGDQIDTALVLDRCKLSDLATRLGGGTTPPASRDVELF